MKAQKFSESILVTGSPEQIFDYTQDYTKRLSWDTFLVKAELLNGATAAGKGVRAWCISRNGLGMETEYVSFNRPKVTAIKMTRGPYLFKDFAASWNYRQTGGLETLVTFTYSFSLSIPFKPFGFLVKVVLQKNVKQRLVDLKMRFEEQEHRMLEHSIK